MPAPEMVLWTKLRGKQVQGHRFRRQYGVGPYVVDFYCPEILLAIEIDGESHFVDGAEQLDLERQQFIESIGVSFLRFTNADVMRNLDGVLLTILNRIGEIGNSQQ